MSNSLIFIGSATTQAHADAATYYDSQAGGLFAGAGTEAAIELPIRDAGTFTKLRVYVTSNNVSSNSTATLRKSRADTSLLATITGNTANQSFEDTTNSATFAATDEVDLEVTVPSVSGTRYVYTSAVDVVFAPTTTSNTITFARAGQGTSTFSTASTTWYMTFNGQWGQGTTEANQKQRIGYVATLSDLEGYVSANARTTDTTVRLRKNGANGNQLITWTSGQTGTKEDTSNTDTTAAGDDLNYSLTTGTGTENFTIQHANCSIISTDGEFHFGTGTNGTGTAIAAAADVAYPIAGEFTSVLIANVANIQAKARFTHVMRYLTTYANAGTQSGTATIALRIGSSDSALSVAYTNGQSGWKTNTSDLVAIADGNLLSTHVTVAAGTGSLTLCSITMHGDNAWEQTLTPTVATAPATGVAPTLSLGGLTLTPTVATSPAVGVAPTLSLVTKPEPDPATCAAEASSQDGFQPELLLGGLTLTPTVATTPAVGVAPTITLALTATVNAASATVKIPADEEDYLLLLGGLDLTPTVAIAPAVGVDPTITLGGLTLTVDPATTAAVGVAPYADVQGPGAQTAEATPATAAAEGVAPTLSFGGVTTVVTAASAAGTGVAPTLSFGGITLVATPAVAQCNGVAPVLAAALAITPTEATSVAQGVAPTIALGGLTQSVMPATASAVGVAPTLDVQGGALTPTPVVAPVEAPSPTLRATLHPSATAMAVAAPDTVEVVTLRPSPAACAGAVCTTTLALEIVVTPPATRLPRARTRSPRVRLGGFLSPSASAAQTAVPSVALSLVLRPDPATAWMPFEPAYEVGEAGVWETVVPGFDLSTTVGVGWISAPPPSIPALGVIELAVSSALASPDLRAQSEFPLTTTSTLVAFSPAIGVFEIVLSASVIEESIDTQSEGSFELTVSTALSTPPGSLLSTGEFEIVVNSALTTASTPARGETHVASARPVVVVAGPRCWRNVSSTRPRRLLSSR